MWLCHKQEKDKKSEKGKGKSGNATVEDHVRLCEQVEKALGKGAKK